MTQKTIQKKSDDNSKDSEDENKDSEDDTTEDDKSRGEKLTGKEDPERGARRSYLMAM